TVAFGLIDLRANDQPVLVEELVAKPSLLENLRTLAHNRLGRSQVPYDQALREGLGWSALTGGLIGLGVFAVSGSALAGIGMGVADAVLRPFLRVAYIEMADRIAQRKVDSRVKGDGEGI
ncbi:MAG: hypothetical protein P4M15_08050, partial [Alphaproteobacteria bacterium]|nr:hypothetical protein [Alphaproteobacteria bacterium]